MIYMLGLIILLNLLLLWVQYGGNKHSRGFELTKGAPYDTLLPKRASWGSAGYDFYAPEDIEIKAHSFSKLVPMNIKAYMGNNEYLALVIRSGLATKEDKGYLMISQGTGIIDADYYSNPTNDGNIGAVFYNRSDNDITIKKGDRCCQGIFHTYLTIDDDNAAGKRNGGYGSSGK